MSHSLLKREIEQEFLQLEKKNQKKGKKKSGEASLQSLLPPTRHGLKKKLAQLKAKKTQQRNPGVPQFKLQQSTAISQQESGSKAQKKKALIRENIKKLVQLSGQKVSSDAAQVIVAHTDKVKRSKRSREEEDQNPDDLPSVFDESDFAKLSQEYFINSNVEKKKLAKKIKKKKAILDEDF